MILRSLLIVFLLATAFSSFSQAEGDENLAFTYRELSDPGLSIQLYPNPTQDYINVKLGDLKAKNVRLSLHNIIGNELSAETEQIEDNVVRIKVKDMAPGYYFITIKDDVSRFRGSYKFLKR